VRDVLGETCQPFPLFGGEQGARHCMVSAVITKGLGNRAESSLAYQGVFPVYQGGHKGLPI
jgi:hypothetical protein